MENDMVRKKRTNGKSRPLTEAILAEHLERFGKGFDTKLKALETKLEAKIDFVRQDFKEHLYSVERRLEQKIDSVYSELKSTQLAVREIKYESIQHDKRLQEHGERLERIEKDHGSRLERIERDHGQRLKRIEEIAGDHGKRLKRIEEKVEQLAA